MQELEAVSQHIDTTV